MKIEKAFEKIRAELPISEDTPKGLVGIQDGATSESGVQSLIDKTSNANWTQEMLQNNSQYAQSGEISEEKVDRFIEFCQQNNLSYFDIELSLFSHPNASNAPGYWDRPNFEKALGAEAILQAADKLSDNPNLLENNDLWRKVMPDYDHAGDMLLRNLVLQSEFKKYSEKYNDENIAHSSFWNDTLSTKRKLISESGEHLLSAIQYVNNNDCEGDNITERVKLSGLSKYNAFYKTELELKGNVAEGIIEGHQVRTRLNNDSNYFEEIPEAELKITSEEQGQELLADLFDEEIERFSEEFYQNEDHDNDFVTADLTTRITEPELMEVFGQSELTSKATYDFYTKKFIFEDVKTLVADKLRERLNRPVEIANNLEQYVKPKGDSLIKRPKK